MRSSLLRHFPEIDAAYAHRKRDYTIAALTFASVAICMAFEVSGSVWKQYALGFIALVCLIGFLRGETREVRLQVAVAVALTTIGEYVASVGLHRNGAQECWPTPSVCPNSRPAHQGSTQSSIAGVTCARSLFTN